MPNRPNDEFLTPTRPVDTSTHESGAPAHKRPRRRRHPVRWIVMSLVLVLIAGGGYVAFNYQRFVAGVTHVDAILPPVVDDDGNALPDVDGESQNILLVGDDHRPDGATDADLAKLGTESDGGGTNTDTMIVLHLPADGSGATMISFPRDSWVPIEGFGKGKLNSAYSLGSATGGDEGGAQLLVQTIQQLSGLTIDHYVRVSMLGFYDMVEALGPIDVCLNNAVNDPYSTLNLPAGVSTLNAQQALAFVRQRHGLPNGDLDRQVRQQYFLSVEARQILSAGTLLNPIKLGRVLDAVSASVETDPGLNFINLAAQMKDVRADNITSATIPISGTPTIYVGGSPLSIVEVDTAAMPEFINNLIGQPSAYTDAIAAAPADVTVTVMNARAVAGVAGVATEALTGYGFVTLAPETVEVQDVTTIQYPAGQEAAAKAVALYLPSANVLESSEVTGVTVFLGTDGLTVTDVAPPADPTNETLDPVVPVPEETASGTTYAAGACIN